MKKPKKYQQSNLRTLVTKGSHSSSPTTDPVLPRYQNVSLIGTYSNTTKHWLGENCTKIQFFMRYTFLQSNQVLKVIALILYKVQYTNM